MDRDHADRRQFRCMRCGRYAVTGTALTLLSHRIPDDPDGAWRLSHQIRLRQDPDKWPLIDSSNLDELLAVPLPRPPEQLRRFVRWLAAKTDADGFVRTPMDVRHEAAAICGTGKDGFGHLLPAAVSNGLVTSERDGVRLTMSGWEMANQPDEPASVTARAPWPLPSWVGRLSDDALRSLLNEVYGALNAGLVALPMMGARAAFDRAMDLILNEDKGSFASKISAMQSAGRLDARGAEILGYVIDAGSATAHRGWHPDADTVSVVILELENAIRDWFVRDNDAAAVRASTPARRR
jgi:hypothetical protein